MRKLLIILLILLPLSSFASNIIDSREAEKTVREIEQNSNRHIREIMEQYHHLKQVIENFIATQKASFHRNFPNGIGAPDKIEKAVKKLN